MSNQRIIACNYLRGLFTFARKRQLCFACPLIKNEHTIYISPGQREREREGGRRRLAKKIADVFVALRQSNSSVDRRAAIGSRHSRVIISQRETNCATDAADRYVIIRAGIFAQLR